MCCRTSHINTKAKQTKDLLVSFSLLSFQTRVWKALSVFIVSSSSSPPPIYPVAAAVTLTGIAWSSGPFFIIILPDLPAAFPTDGSVFLPDALSLLGFQNALLS